MPENNKIVRCNLCEIKFFGSFKNGFDWSGATLIERDDGIYSIVGGTKSSIHLIPEGGTMWDRFSVPKNKIKIIRRVKE